MLFETEEGADNSSAPVVERETVLIDLELFRLQLAAGFEFAPRLRLVTGAEVAAPSSLSVPISAGFDVDMRAGVRDGEPFYEREVTSLLPKVSDPGLYEALSAEASAFAKCEILALLSQTGSVIEAGPTLGVRADAAFTLKPLVDPWWEILGTVTAFAGVELNVLGLVNVLDAEQDLQTWDLFSLDAGGPLASFAQGEANKLNGADESPTFSPVGDPRVRWMRSLQPKENQITGTPESFAVDLTGTDDFVVGTGSLTFGMLSRITPEGEIVWSSEPNAIGPFDGVAEDDGGFTVVGAARGTVTLVRFDGAGNIIWKKAHGVDNGGLWFQSRDLVRRITMTGQVEYFVVGQVAPGDPGGFHAGLMKLDADGELVWSKVYVVDPFDEEGTQSDGRCLTFSADGNLVLGGTTAANVNNDPLDLVNITQNGLAMKVNPDDGSVLWTTVIGERHSITYHAVEEFPDGSIVLGGTTLGNVTDRMPAMLLTLLSSGESGVFSEGDLVDSLLVGGQPSFSDAELAEQGFEVIESGPFDKQRRQYVVETDYDTIYDMKWDDGYLWVCGQMGIFNRGSVGGVAEGASAFTLRFDRNFNVDRYAVHAGPGTEGFRSLLPTENGLLVTGTSKSFHPWPGGASETSVVAPGSLLVAMLPWENKINFHNASAGKKTVADRVGDVAAGSYFITPRVLSARQHTQETNQGLFAGLGQANVASNRNRRASVMVSDLVVSDRSTFIISQSFGELEEFKALEFVPESLITNRETWKRWWQVDGSNDQDGDGLDADAEFFLGTSPGVKDVATFTFEYLYDDATEENFVRFTMPRAKLASPELPGVYSDEAFEFTSLRDDVMSDVESLDTERDTVILELPATEAKQFYQLVFPQ